MSSEKRYRSRSEIRTRYLVSRRSKNRQSEPKVIKELRTILPRTELQILQDVVKQGQPSMQPGFRQRKLIFLPRNTDEFKPSQHPPAWSSYSNRINEYQYLIKKINQSRHRPEGNLSTRTVDTSAQVPVRNGVVVDRYYWDLIKSNLSSNNKIKSILVKS